MVLYMISLRSSTKMSSFACRLVIFQNDYPGFVFTGPVGWEWIFHNDSSRDQYLDYPMVFLTTSRDIPLHGYIECYLSWKMVYIYNIPMDIFQYLTISHFSLYTIFHCIILGDIPTAPSPVGSLLQRPPAAWARQVPPSIFTAHVVSQKHEPYQQIWGFQTISTDIWRFPEMGVSLNHPNFRLGFSLINHPYLGTPILGIPISYPYQYGYGSIPKKYHFQVDEHP